jgi:3-oxoacyl-[acyl-carrier protein] reductase
MTKELAGRIAFVAVAFLAGPRSKYMTGQVLRVDGGETLFPG